VIEHVFREVWLDFSSANLEDDFGVTKSRWRMMRELEDRATSAGRREATVTRDVAGDCIGSGYFPRPLAPQLESRGSYIAVYRH
jgi:hypothetical protein